MKLLVALVLFLAAAQDKAVISGAGLKYVNKYFTPITGMSSDGGVSYRPSSRIISGTPVAQGQIPWQALLVLDTTSICGGVLISNEWVLTVAHCVKGHSSFQIYLGGTSFVNVEDNTVTQYAREAFIHANFNEKTFANDIGLLKLTTAVNYTKYISALRLPSLSQTSSSYEGTTAIVSGFGRTSNASENPSDVLLEADVTVISNSVCTQTFGEYVESTNLCTLGANGKSPCQIGDSGDPLAVLEADAQYTLIGLMSYGVHNCPADMPAAYVRVTSYLNWISNNTGIALQPV